MKTLSSIGKQSRSQSVGNIEEEKLAKHLPLPHQNLLKASKARKMSLVEIKMRPENV